MSRLIVIVTALLLLLLVAAPAYAAADHAIIEKVDEAGKTTWSVISTKGTWTDDGIGTRFTSADGHQFVDEWLYFTGTVAIISCHGYLPETEFLC